MERASALQCSKRGLLRSNWTLNQIMLAERSSTITRFDTVAYVVSGASILPPCIGLTLPGGANKTCLYHLHNLIAVSSQPGKAV